MLIYPAVLEPDTNETLLVTFPDIPEAVTFGEDEDEALAYAVDALETMLAARIDDREDIPAPSPIQAGQHGVRLPVLTSAKVQLYQQMRAQGIGKAELARRLHQPIAQVDRLLDLSHVTRIDRIEAAFAALGKRLEVKAA